MEKLTADFQKIIKDFMDKKHDLLNTNDNAFDRDWVEFNVDVSQLDTKL
jgi:dynein heavy chain